MQNQNNNPYLFRGKRIDGQGWVEGMPIKIGDRLSIVSEIFDYGDNYKVMEWEVEPETVGQWTGAQCDNGQDIFRGDIVRVHGEAIFIVDWNDSYCRFGLMDLNGIFTTTTLCSYRPDFYEKLGNIFDNPDLLQ